MTARKDQVRDRDSIQRQTIVVRVAGAVDVHLGPCSDREGYLLGIHEPKASRNAGQAKIAFEFSTIKEAAGFTDALKAAVERRIAEEAKSR